jgi:hypothetical protein
MEGDSELQVQAQLDIHGRRHEIAFPVKVRVRQQELNADFQFPVPYRKWGMKDPGNFVLHVGDTVQVHIHAVGQLSTP